MVQKGTQHPTSGYTMPSKKDHIRLGNTENQMKRKNTKDTAGKKRLHSLKTHRSSKKKKEKWSKKAHNTPPQAKRYTPKKTTSA